MMKRLPYSLELNIVFKAALIVIFVCRVTSATSFEKELRENLLKNNSKKIRPAPINESINVRFAFNLTQVLKISEDIHMIKTKCIMVMKWKNNYMKWNRSQWGKISTLRIFPDEIWTPDIFLWEDINNNVAFDLRYSIYSYSDGWQEWYLPTTFESNCNFDVTKFPYDTHICHMTFLSWSYNEAQLNMTIDHFPTYGLPFPISTSSDWNIFNFSVVRNEMNYYGVLWPYVRFTFVVGRKPTQFFSNILVPSFIQMTIIIFTFILPPESGERISVSVTVLLVFAVYLEVIREQVPSGSSTTAVSKFYLAAMSGSAFSIIVTCFVLVIHFKGSETGVAPVPKWVKAIFLDHVAKFLCLHKDQSIVNDDEFVLSDISSNPDTKEHITNVREAITNAASTNEATNELRIITSNLKEQDMQDNIEAEWHVLAKVVDRLFFIIFLLFFTITSIVILLPIAR